MLTHQDLLVHAPRLRNFSLKLTGNRMDSEDLFQSTIERALAKGHLFQEGTNLFSWSSRIMYNLFISQKRRIDLCGTSTDEVCEDVFSIEPNQLERLELKAVLSSIDELPQAQKDVLFLICQQGMSYEAAAKKLGVPAGTVRSRLFRAREALSKKLYSHAC